MQFKTQFTYEPRFEVSDPTIVTEPGLAMDVPTMLRRYAQGTLSGLSVRNPVFDDLDEPDPTQTPGFDLTDAEAYLRHISDKIDASKRSSAAPPAAPPAATPAAPPAAPPAADNSVNPPKADSEP